MTEALAVSQLQVHAKKSQLVLGRPMNCTIISADPQDSPRILHIPRVENHVSFIVSKTGDGVPQYLHGDLTLVAAHIWLGETLLNGENVQDLLFLISEHKRQIVYRYIPNRDVLNIVMDYS